MFNYQLTYLPPLKMRFCIIKKKTTLEFVLSQLCTWYRMFSAAAGLTNNKAGPLPGLGRLPWPVFFCPQTFCLLTWIWVLSSPKWDSRWTWREPPLPWILAATCHQLFLCSHTLKALLLYKKNIIPTTHRKLLPAKDPNQSSSIPFQLLMPGNSRWPSWINTAHRKLGSTSQQVGMCCWSTNGKVLWPSINCVSYADEKHLWSCLLIY